MFFCINWTREVTLIHGGAYVCEKGKKIDRETWQYPKLTKEEWEEMQRRRNEDSNKTEQDYLDEMETLYNDIKQKNQRMR